MFDEFNAGYTYLNATCPTYSLYNALKIRGLQEVKLRKNSDPKPVLVPPPEIAYLITVQYII